MKKARLPTCSFGKFKPKVDGPFGIIKKINDNTYKIDFPGDYNISITFNVAGSLPCVESTFSSIM